MSDLQQQQSQQKQPAPKTESSTPVPGTGTGNLAAEKESLLIRTLASITTDWKTACGSLLGDVETPVAPPEVPAFKLAAYKLLARRDGSGQAGLPGVKVVLALTDSRKPYAQALDIVEAEAKQDATNRTAIHDALIDLQAGGDVHYNSDIVLATYQLLSAGGREWWKGEDAVEWTGAFAAYIANESMLQKHVGGPGSVFTKGVYDTLAKRRQTELQPLLNQLKLGALAPKVAQDPAAPAATVDPAKAKQWDEQAVALKKEISDHLPEDGETKAKAPLTPQLRLTLVGKITAAPIEVRDRISQDTVFMRRVAMLGESTAATGGSRTQTQTLFRALDPVEALYDKVTAATVSYGVVQPHQSQALQGQARFDAIKDFLAGHPGKEAQPLRIRVMSHPMMLDTIGEDLKKDLWKLATRGTLEPTIEDKLYAAIKSGNAQDAARALLNATPEDREALKGLQTDVMFRNAAVSDAMKTMVTVDGVTVRPADLLSRMWGLRPGSTKDDGQTGATEKAVDANGQADDDARPLNFDERQRLDTQLYTPAVDDLVSLLSAADSWFMPGARTSDSKVENRLNAFGTKCAEPDFVKLIRRSGTPPGRELATRYNARTGKSIQGLIKNGCGDSTRLAAERILNITIDSASVGMVGGGIGRAGDTPDGAPVSMEQALREVTVDGGQTVSQVVHDTANAFKTELHSGLIWDSASVGGMTKIWTPYKTQVEPKLDAIQKLTKRKVFAIELIQNAYMEIDGPFTKQLEKRFNEKDRNAVTSLLGLSPEDIAARAKEATAGAPVDQNAATRAQGEQVYGPKAAELFEALCRLRQTSEKPAFASVQEKLDAYKKMTTVGGGEQAAAQAQNHEAAPDLKVGGGIALGDNPDDYYRVHYGLTPTNHAIQVARSFKSNFDKDVTEQTYKPEDVAKMLAVPVDAVTSATVAAPPANEAPVIDEANRTLVRPDFTVEKARSLASQMWKLLHESGKVNLIQTTLYGMYNDEEQRLIRLAFRQLSGGIDWQFYVQQAKVQAKHAGETDDDAYGDDHTTVTGAEGTAEGQKVATGTTIHVSGNDGEIDAALAISQRGTQNIRDRLNHELDNDHIKQVFRLIDDATDAECREVLADTELMATMQDKLRSSAWDRVYRVLTGQDDLATRLESRAHGDYDSGWSTFWHTTDKEGMKEEVKVYVARMRPKFEAEEIKKAKAAGGPLPEPEVIELTVDQRVRDSCKKLASNPEVMSILDRELSGAHLAATQGLILNAGQESNVAHVTGDGDTEDKLSEIKRMPAAERKKRLNDPEYMMRLQGQMPEADYQMAIKLLQSDAADTQLGAGPSEVHDKLGDIARMLAATGTHDTDDILQRLTELSQAEHERLLADPGLVASLMAAFKNGSEKKRALVERILNFRKEKADEKLGHDIVMPDAPENAEGGRTIPQEEQQRLAYLKENAIARILQGAEVSWDALLKQLVEVYKLDLVPKNIFDPAKSAEPPPPTGPNKAPPKDPNAGLASDLEQKLRASIHIAIKGQVTNRADTKDKQETVRKAVMREQDPSFDRILEAQDTIGRNNYDDISDTLKNASADKLLQDWLSITNTKPNGAKSFFDVYHAYRTAYDAAGGEKPESSKEQEALQAAKLAYMDYVIDVSGMFEHDVLGASGWSYTHDKEPTKEAKDGEQKDLTKARDNNRYNDWVKIIRDRIPTLPKAKIAEMIGATDRPADVALLDNPNRTAHTGLEFRTDEYLRKRGTVGTGANVADAERGTVDDTMAKYGHEIADAETHQGEGYGKISPTDGAKIEKTGADFDRAMQEFTAARAKIASIAAALVAVVVGAAVTILTGGAGAGVAWMLVAGAISGAAAAAGGALTQSAIKGNEYEMDTEGVNSIVEGAVTGLVFAGTTKIAENLMSGLANIATYGRQLEVAEEALKTNPTVWQQLLSGAKGMAQAGGEMALAQGMNDVTLAGLSALDPSLWVHGWDEGVIKARHKIREKMAGAGDNVLRAAVTGVLMHGVGGVKNKILGKTEVPPLSREDKTLITSRLESHIKRMENNAARYMQVDEIMLQAFSSFAADKLVNTAEGKGLDWNTVGDDVFQQFISAWQGLSPQIHANHYRLGMRRKEAIQHELKENASRLTEAEKKHYQSINPEVAVGDIITVDEYLSARQGMFEARVAAWQQAIGRELTPNERAAFQKWCRQAGDSTEYQQRLNTNPLTVDEVKAAAPKFVSDVKDPAGTNDAKVTDPNAPKTNDGKDAKTVNKDAKETKPASADELAKLTGSVDSIAGTSTGEGEVAPDKVQQGIARALPNVAADFPPDAVHVLGVGVLQVKVGESSVLVKVATMAAEGAGIARFRFTGTESALIEVSERAGDHHLERVIADMVSQLRATREAQLAGKELPKQDALAEGATGKELSARDQGKIAQLKALLRQRAVAATEGGTANHEGIAKVDAEIDALLASIGMANPASRGRLDELVVPQLSPGEHNQLVVKLDQSRRDEVAKGVDSDKKTELHNHFMGVVDAQAFADAASASAANKAEKKGVAPPTESGWELALASIVTDTKLNAEHSHKNPAGANTDRGNNDPIAQRGTSGDALALARLTSAVLADPKTPLGKNPPEWLVKGDAALLAANKKLAEAGNEPGAHDEALKEVAAAKAKLAEDAVRASITATEDTDFNSAYEIRDALVKNTMGGPEADRLRLELEAEKKKDPPDKKRIDALQEQIEGAAYTDVAKQTVRTLILDGLIYSEQSNSIKKLNARFTKTVMDKVIWDVAAELVASHQITEAQAAQIRQLTMVVTVFFGGEETRDGQLTQDQLKDREEKFSPAAWEKQKGDLRTQLETRSDIMGVDIAGPETVAFDKADKAQAGRFKELYNLLKEEAKKRGRPLTLRPHVGEGFTDTEAGKDFNKNESKMKGEEAAHYDRARRNLDTLLKEIQALGGELDPNLVIIRFGHATHATPDQAALMAQLGIIAEVNLHSNIETGSLMQVDKKTGEKFQDDNYDDHSLLTLLYVSPAAKDGSLGPLHVILSTDAHDVMNTNISAEYKRARDLIEEFLAGGSKVRVSKDMAAGRGTQRVVNEGTPYARTEYELGVKDLNAGELEKFTKGYEQLNKAGKDYRDRIAKDDKGDKLLWKDLFELLNSPDWETDPGKRLHTRNLLERLGMADGTIDEAALAKAKEQDPAGEAKAREAIRKLAIEQHQKKSGWDKSEAQQDALEGAKSGNPSDQQRDVLAAELKRQIPDMALDLAVHNGLPDKASTDPNAKVDVKSVVSLVFPGNGEMGIKRMNDEVLGQRLNDDLIRARDEKVREVFAKHGLTVVDQNYKVTTVASEKPAAELGQVIKAALADLDVEMKAVLKAQLDIGKQYWTAARDKAVKSNSADDIQSADKHLKNIGQMLGEVVTRDNFQYDMQIGAADLKGGKKASYGDIVDAEMNATKAALMARDVPGSEDARARVYDAEGFHQFCVDTIAMRKELAGKVLTVQGVPKQVLKADGTLDEDVLRAVRKNKIPSAGQEETLKLVDRYFKRVNALDYFAPYKGDEIELQGEKVKHARELLAALESDRHLSKEQSAEIEQLLAGSAAQSGTASEAQFYNKAAKLHDRIVLNADIKDMGVDLWKDYEKQMAGVAGGADVRQSSVSAADNIVEFKRNAREKFQDFYKTVLLPEAEKLAAGDTAKLDALKGEQTPLLLLGGDELTISLPHVFEDLGLVDHIVAKLAEIANARVAVTHTGSGDGAAGHKDAMKNADAGHSLLKKYEDLTRAVEDARRSLPDEKKVQATTLADKLKGLYTTDDNGKTTLRSPDGTSIDKLRIDAAALLGVDRVNEIVGVKDGDADAN